MLALLALACVDPPSPDVSATSPTWHQDVAPIVVERCGGCHTSGGIAPFPLDSYVAAAPMAEAAVAAVEAGTMPPFSARETETCTPRLGWVDDPRLSADEKAVLRAWADAGAPEGDAATAAPLPNALVPDLADVDLELQPASGFVTRGEDDEFVCVSMDPGLRADTWVTGIQAVPGNTVVNHHIVVFADPGAATTDWGDAYVDCDTLDSTDAIPLAVWTPGSDPVALPEGAGIALPAGSRIVMQIHFHPAGAVAADPDVSTVRLRLQDEPPEHEAVITSIGNFSSEEEGLLPEEDDRRHVEFRIPPDVADHRETMVADQGDPGGSFRFFSMMPHQHYIGTGMEVHWTHTDHRMGEPSDECLVNSGWDFNWQRNYTYDAPYEELPEIREGDTFWMQCSWDNTATNPWVQKMMAETGATEPFAVELGESTRDEMCILIVGVLL